MKVRETFVAINGSVFIKSKHNPTLFHPVDSLNNLMLRKEQAEVVAEVLNQVYHEGHTTAMNKVRAYLDQVDTENSYEQTH